jgi:pimeloyl-ACP methyl ester carboxylesterase
VANSTGRKWKLAGVILLGLMVAGVLVLQYAVRGGFAPMSRGDYADGYPIWQGAARHKIEGRLYVKGELMGDRPLVVVIHGDAPFRKPSYHYAFAAALAERLPGIPVVGLLRPGFADPYGGRSDGRRGNAAGDDYTRAVTLDVASAIKSLRDDYASTAVVLVGHSGGAAISANVAAASPGLIDSLILVSCPCDVPAFRKHMAWQQFSPFWAWPSDSESPLDTVKTLTATTRIFAITGEQDPITLVDYARVYTDAAVRRGLSATLTVLPERGHEILLDDAVLDFTQQRVATFISSDLLSPQPDASHKQPPM